MSKSDKMKEFLETKINYIKIKIKLNKKQDAGLAFTYYNIAELYSRTGNFKEALFLLEKAYNILFNNCRMLFIYI